MKDIDLDTAKTEVIKNIAALIPEATRASIRNADGSLQAHPSGIYLQDVPARKGVSLLDHKLLENTNAIKLDLLHNRIYDGFTSRKAVRRVVDRINNGKYDWSILLNPSICDDKTFHIGKHLDVVYMYKPQSIEELAAVIAMVRPAKKYLIGKPMEHVLKHIWKKEDKGFQFKKSHAIAYAYGVCLDLETKEDLDGEW